MIYWCWHKSNLAISKSGRSVWSSIVLKLRWLLAVLWLAATVPQCMKCALKPIQFISKLVARECDGTTAKQCSMSQLSAHTRGYSTKSCYSAAAAGHVECVCGGRNEKKALNCPSASPTGSLETFLQNWPQEIFVFYPPLLLITNCSHPLTVPVPVISKTIQKQYFLDSLQLPYDCPYLPVTTALVICNFKCCWLNGLKVG